MQSTPTFHLIQEYQNLAVGLDEILKEWADVDEGLQLLRGTQGSKVWFTFWADNHGLSLCRSMSDDQIQNLLGIPSGVVNHQVDNNLILLLAQLIPNKIYEGANQ